ncbi:uncharacterized protein [Rutidosis leptorrhynchoides]|uniref:uncharacterized protein n=1 Tax=Rutidosis leptorrhynchoides TaxID=125765 RepID=UPI003A98EE7B
MAKLLEKDQPFLFDDECIKAFNLLKEKLVNPPIIISSDWDKDFELMCDASDYALGAVLGQRVDQHFRPIYYASKTLNGAELNYTTTEKELLAVVFYFDKFRSYLVHSKTTVYTDHSALKYVFQKQDAKHHLIHWVLLFQEFDIEIRDKKGAENVATDYLSRLDNPLLQPLDKTKIRDTFPDEHLMRIDLIDEVPWFSDYSNYLASNVLRKVLWRESWKNMVTPYHPQTSGQVKNINRALKRILEKTVSNNPKIWSTKLDEELWAFRTAYKTPIGTTPFHLVYGKGCHIPVEVEYKAYWAIKEINIDLEKAKGKRVTQLHELEELRLEAYDNYTKRRLSIGMMLDSKVPKNLIPTIRWTGPYIVKKAYPTGYVELYGNGNTFKVNGHRLKVYRDDINAIELDDIKLSPK